MTFANNNSSDPGNLPAPPAACSLADDGLVELLRSMMLIRAFEERLMRMPRPGFQLLSSGEEAVAVGVCAALGPDDQLLSSGRAIGPALARGLDPAAVMAELQGKITGPCRGKAGRGHLAQPAAGFFGAHAVVGGNLTIAAGVALAAQLRRCSSIAACIFGDGACGAGSLHETLNIAALWKLPLLLVCCNNQYSVSTPVHQALAPKRLADLALPFGIPAQTVDGMDVVGVRQAARAATAMVRSGAGPFFLECLAYRFATHSTSSRESRPQDEVLCWRERCPIQRLAARLIADGVLDQEGLAALQREATALAEAAADQADTAPFPELTEGLADVD